MRFSLSSANDQKLIIVSCLFFLIVKAAWVILPAQAMGVPRLGDDSFVYLWTGASTALQPRVDTPAIKDIISLRHLEDNINHDVEFARARTTMRTTAVSTSPFAMLTGALLNAGLSNNAAFAVSELIVAVVLMAGIFALITSLFGSQSAGISLLLLASVVLPQQGIHYLVPSVLTFGLAALLFAELGALRPRIWIVVTLSVLMSLIHSIGLVYLGLSMAYIIAVPVIRDRVIRFPMLPVVGVLLAICLAYGLNKIGGGLPADTAGTGVISLTEIPSNLVGASAFVWQSFLSVPILWVFGIVGLGLACMRSKSRSIILILIFIGGFFGGTVFHLDGYPGELSSRLLVMIILVLAGAAGYFIAFMMEFSFASKVLAIAVLAVHLAFQGMATTEYFFKNINSRSEVLSQTEIRTDLEALPDNASIIWSDPDISMMAAFLEGGDRFRALPYPMIDGSPSADKALETWKPGFLAVPVPKHFNAQSLVESTSLNPRFYGLSFADYSTITIGTNSERAHSVFVRLSRQIQEGEITLGSNKITEHCAFVEWMPENTDGKVWLELDLSKCPAGTLIELRSQKSDLAVLGLRVTLPEKRINWPWGSAATIRGIPRDVTFQDVLLKFDWVTLLGASLANRFPVTHPIALMSDESGIVWLRTENSMQENSIK